MCLVVQSELFQCSESISLALAVVYSIQVTSLSFLIMPIARCTFLTLTKTRKEKPTSLSLEQKRLFSPSRPLFHFHCSHLSFFSCLLAARAASNGPSTTSETQCGCISIQGLRPKSALTPSRRARYRLNSLEVEAGKKYSLLLAVVQCALTANFAFFFCFFESQVKPAIDELKFLDFVTVAGSCV